jgi:hypothetical protein
MGRVRAWVTAVAAGALVCGCGGSGGGATGGSGTGSTGTGTTAPPGASDFCAPYTGSYAGILTFTWTSGSQNGTGTITVHFTMACDGVFNNQVQLHLTRISSDNTFFATPNPTDDNDSLSLMTMPPNPPASGDSSDGIDLIFPNNDYELSMSGPLTVTSGAAIIANDPSNTDAWFAGNPAYTAAGMPDGATVQTRTFKVNKQ